MFFQRFFLSNTHVFSALKFTYFQPYFAPLGGLKHAPPLDFFGAPRVLHHQSSFRGHPIIAGYQEIAGNDYDEHKPLDPLHPRFWGGPMTRTTFEDSYN